MTDMRYSWGIDSISNIKRKSCVSLLEPEDSILKDLNKVDFEGIKKLILDAGNVLWVIGMDAAPGAMINGLVRVVRNEVPGSNLRTVNAPFTLAGRLDALVITGLATGGSVLSNYIMEPFYLSDAKFAIMARTGLREQQQNSEMKASYATDSLGGLVAKSTSVVEAAEHLKIALVQRVAELLQTQTSEIDTSRPLHSYGFDFLVAIEVVNWG